MAEEFGEGGMRKCDFVSDVVNRTIHDLVIRSTRTEEIRNYYHISVIGYGGSVGPVFSGGLAGRTHVPVAEIAEMPARLENRTKRVPDGAGGLVEQQVRFPVWMDPVANGGTPMCEAFKQTRDLLSQWIGQNPHSFPPTVLHLTDGESTDGDCEAIAKEILGLGTSDGNALVFNCHVSSRHATKIEYPNNSEVLPDEFARKLYSISSTLPAPFVRAATDIGLSVTEGAKGFVFNGDPVSVAQFFEIGTRPANLR